MNDVTETAGEETEFDLEVRLEQTERVSLRHVKAAGGVRLPKPVQPGAHADRSEQVR